MCYSAQVWGDYHAYMRKFGADIDIRMFYDLYVELLIAPMASS